MVGHRYGLAIELGALGQGDRAQPLRTVARVPNLPKGKKNSGVDQRSAKVCYAVIAFEPFRPQRG